MFLAPPKPRFPPLLGLLYAEFHPLLGPIIAHHTPDSLPITALCPSLHALLPYLIPRRALSNHMLTFHKPPVTLIGFPCYITHERYTRNDFAFNLVFVFNSTDDVDCWKKVVKKTAGVLQTLEKELGFLSEREKEDTSVDRVKWMLDSMFEDLNTFHECRVPIGKIR